MSETKKKRRKVARLHYSRLSLEQLAFKRLVEVVKKRKLNGRIIRFPLVFSVICPIYCLTKPQAWILLHSMRNLGWIDIIPYQGIKLMRASFWGK